jgi:hypothetical protein
VRKELAYSYWQPNNMKEHQQALLDAVKAELLMELRAQQYDIVSSMVRPGVDFSGQESGNEPPRAMEHQSPAVRSQARKLEHHQLKAIVNSLLRENDYIDAPFNPNGPFNQGVGDGVHLGNSHDPRQQREQGLLYGVGAAALMGFLVPSFRSKAQSLLVRITQEGIELLEKARSTMIRAREDLEDLIAEASLDNFRRK